jgi:UDP-N-acetyl-D-mannosaminuronic acid dehydrogenase
MPELPKVAVVGLGYIGLPTAALIASRGMQVIGVDANKSVVETISAGAIHIDEPDLEGLVQKVVSTGTLVATSQLQPADVFIIAVPTPIRDDKRPDLTHVFAAADAIARVIVHDNLIVLESTCPVGTTEELAKRILNKRPELRVGSKPGISIACCPERVLPGRILSELVSNDRCIGGLTPTCTRRAQNFYKRFVRGACIGTSSRVAEMVKLSENAFRDTNIAFANELSLICDRLGVNVWEVIDLANRHPRVNILRPGPGVGGHCIAVDPWFIVDTVPDLAKLIRISREVNDSKIEHTTKLAIGLIEEHAYVNVACCGLTYKPNVDDLRESPAKKISLELARRYGERIRIVEPHIKALPPEFGETGAQLTELDVALQSCELAVLLVGHDQFKMIPLADRRHLTVIDTQGIWQDMQSQSWGRAAE